MELRLVIGLLGLGVALACHAEDEPFDFGYAISGDSTQRPALVFNDGRDTWIEPVAGRETAVAGGSGERRGAYLVVPGLPGTIALTVGGRSVTVRRLGAAPQDAAAAAPVPLLAVPAMPAPPMPAPPVCGKAEERRIDVRFAPWSPAVDGGVARQLEEALSSLRSSGAAPLVVATARAPKRTLAAERAEAIAAWFKARGVRVEVRTTVEAVDRIVTELRWTAVPPCAAAPVSVPVPIPAPASAAAAKSPALESLASAGVPPHAETAVGATEGSVPAAVAAEPVPVVAPESAPEVATVTQEPPAVPPPAPVQFVLAEGDILSERLRGWATEQGWTLEWQAGDDFRLKKRMEFSGRDAKAVLSDLLSAFGLRGQLVRQTNTVYVR